MAFKGATAQEEKINYIEDVLPSKKETATADVILGVFDKQAKRSPRRKEVIIEGYIFRDSEGLTEKCEIWEDVRRSSDNQTFMTYSLINRTRMGATHNEELADIAEKYFLKKGYTVTNNVRDAASPGTRNKDYFQLVIPSF